MAGKAIFQDVVPAYLSDILEDIPIPSSWLAARKAGFLPTIPNEFLSDLRTAETAAQFEDVLVTRWQDVFVTEIVDAGERGAVNGGRGFDFASYGDGDTGVIASLDRSARSRLPQAEDVKYRSVEGLIGSDHDDFLVGDGRSNLLFGGNGDDWLFGDAGRKGKGDLLAGGGGGDVLVGGHGGDILVGGADGDSFVLDPASAIVSPRDPASGQLDQIADFEQSDRIVINTARPVVEDTTEVVLNVFQIGDTATHELVGKALPTEAFRANATGTAGDGDDVILYDTDDGWLSFDPDGNGPADAIRFARLLADPLGNHPDLSAADIFVGYVGTSHEGTGI